MQQRLEFHSEAAREVDEAFEWYRVRSALAARAFLDELDHAFERIAASPDRWPHRGSTARRYLMHRFPYQLIYRERDGRIEIIAVAHARRRPGYWRKRLR